MMWDDSDRMVWFKTAVIVVLFALGFANALRADDLEDSGGVWAVRDLSAGTATQFYAVDADESGGIWAIRNLSTGEPTKFLWIAR